MSKSWPKLIRDPVHDIISFENKPWDNLLLKLINTREFQRLRRIKQLGMSELVFPGANHNRFAHSIGVMHNARRFLARIEQLRGTDFDAMQRTALLAAAILHDIGHGPFSHTFEKITGEDHENRTVEIIVNQKTEVNQVLQRHDKDLPEILRRFFEQDPELAGANSSIPEYLVQIVSSQLDADRFDYLLRDAHASGADYGKFDSRWIIQHLVLDEAKKRFHLSNKAYVAAETYIFARYHMYRAVYFHKTTRAAEVMLRLLFARFRDLLGQADDFHSRTKVVPLCPPAVLSAFTAAGKMGLSDYLTLDDHTITEFMKACATSDDEPLKTLATGILNRRLFKGCDATDASSANVGRFVAAASDVMKQSNWKQAFSDLEDNAQDVPYKPYDPDEEEPATQIYVENSLGVAKEFGSLSSAVKELNAKYTLLRYYFPESLRDRIEPLAEKYLRKELKHD